MFSIDQVKSYFSKLQRCCVEAEATDANGREIPLADAFSAIVARLREVHAGGNKVMFIGNGGSAGIASHMAIDHSKNGNIRSMALNDAAAITCLSNDYAYDEVFAKQIAFHARPGDALVAISSSGKSANILKAVDEARKMGCFCITYSGFSAENPLRRKGDFNLFVDAQEYGFVEVGHLALCHAILDFHCGIGVGDKRHAEQNEAAPVAA
jgi:D-sedoheptulose 7-phosphate isomerase